ncbi:exopolysaccharide biosynthesis protein [Hyphococcus flavus]|uniref:Exopolysaccharide biosynthesis protein n=1 Tax=Hyphococcus flavus TaxID=1866326 RepID=A0AAE9ZDZ8_9PROT|nr:exopolysaccharide biosynthesis protein [Hyphococcus flavus]WDI32821.1 exopolysaccharide biosynthesis protein [Hyphococcus flavus]
MTAADGQPAAPMRGATRVLQDVLDKLRLQSSATATEKQTARLGDVVENLDERAFGFLLLLLALPCCLPFVYLLPQIVALPMLALAGQLAAGGRHPWLPKKLHERSFSLDAFQSVLTRAEKYVGWVERIATPRLKPVTGRVGVRLVGGLALIPIASILTPLPSTNTVPGIGVAIMALGLIERDGVLVILGLLLGFMWVFLLLFLGAEAVDLIRGWIAART